MFYDRSQHFRIKGILYRDTVAGTTMRGRIHAEKQKGQCHLLKSTFGSDTWTAVGKLCKNHEQVERNGPVLILSRKLGE